MWFLGATSATRCDSQCILSPGTRHGRNDRGTIEGTYHLRGTVWSFVDCHGEIFLITFPFFHIFYLVPTWLYFNTLMDFELIKS